MGITISFRDFSVSWDFFGTSLFSASVVSSFVRVFGLSGDSLLIKIKYLRYLRCIQRRKSLNLRCSLDFRKILNSRPIIIQSSHLSFQLRFCPILLRRQLLRKPSKNRIVLGLWLLIVYLRLFTLNSSFCSPIDVSVIVASNNINLFLNSLF